MHSPSCGNFDIERTHVVGHSYGGAISLQLALDAPQAVHSLALLEPALLMVPSAETFTKEVGTIAAIYESGDSSSAIAAFLEGVGGPNFKEILEKSLPGGAFENAVADADTFFKIELPALQEWKFTNTEAQRVTAPSLAVLGADSAPMFGEGFALLKDWMPQTEPFVLPGATHFLQMMNPSGMAEALASFFGRHPLAKAG